MPNRSPRFFLPALLALLAFSACYEPKEGCLDITATNFDATADDNCCCEYPVWSVEVLPVVEDVDTSLYSFGSALQNAQGQWYRVGSFVFYLSDFQARQNGDYQLVTDTVQVRAFDGADTVASVIRRDILLFKFPPTLDYDLGEFRPLGTFDQVRFRFGLNDTAHRTVPGSAPNGHPLRIQSDSLWIDRTEGYLWAKMVVTRDSAAGIPSDTLHFRAADVGEVFIESGQAFVHAFATDFTTQVKVDYKKLFDGVDFSVHDTTAWKQKIVENLQNAISVTQSN